MAVYVSNIVIEQGYSFDTSFQLEDTRTNEPLNLTSSTTEGQLRKHYGASTSVSFASTITGNFTFTPIVTGEIVGAYLYEEGSEYGSTTLNLHKKPVITLKNGKNAQLNPIVSNGRVIDVQVLSTGSEYYSIPELVTTGDGTGAILRPVINNGKITDVIVINSGIGYSATTASIQVKPRGSGAIFDTEVRD
ncbi:MAG: hypothetical protein ACO3UU_13370, partial [Minisyncoccia bacterium]